MSNKTTWDTKACNLLKAEIVKRGLSYDDLRVALEKVGIQKSVSNLTKMINEGKFRFAFFLQCAVAIEMKTLRLDDLFITETD